MTEPTLTCQQSQNQLFQVVSFLLRFNSTFQNFILWKAPDKHDFFPSKYCIIEIEYYCFYSLVAAPDAFEHKGLADRVHNFT